MTEFKILVEMFRYDRPLLFTYTVGGKYFLGLVIDDDEKDDVILVTCLSRKMCYNVGEGLTTVHQAFKHPSASMTRQTAPQCYASVQHFICSWATIENVDDYVIASDEQSKQGLSFGNGYNWYRTIYYPKSLSARQKYKIRHRKARR